MTPANKALDTVAIIPARGGSKRLPGKNTKLLGGKPLIEWTLAAARESGVIDLVVVTSDDEEVLNIARAWGAIAIRRPDALASDTATTLDAILHAIRFVSDEGFVSERVMVLQPTSPLRRASHIRDAVKRLEATGGASVVSVTEAEHSPLWANTLPADGLMDGFISPEVKGLRSQDLPTYYRLNGAIYLVKTEELCRQGLIESRPSYALVMDRSASVDIDDLLDFELAELLMLRLTDAS